MGWSDTRYHPAVRCAFCGARPNPSRGIVLVKCVVKSTEARALRCEDNLGCLRRCQVQQRRQEGLAA